MIDSNKSVFQIICMLSSLEAFVLRIAFALLALTASVAAAWAAHHHGHHVSAPEIDGPAGIAAIAVLGGVVAIAYERYRSRG